MAAPSELVGQTIGHYRIIEKLGAGGMGEVYRAQDIRLRRDVAIKVLPSLISSDPERLRRFEQEGAATGSEETSAGRTLMATSRRRRISWARYTSPIPPAPSLSMIR